MPPGRPHAVPTVAELGAELQPTKQALGKQTVALKQQAKLDRPRRAFDEQLRERIDAEREKRLDRLFGSATAGGYPVRREGSPMAVRRHRVAEQMMSSYESWTSWL